MAIVYLSAYLCGVFLLSVLASSAITVAPGGQDVIAVLMVVSGIGAMVFGVATAWTARLPAAHWIRQSRLLRSALIAFASLVTLVVVFGVLG